MAELDKNKEGLQKQVSSVFKGVPHPQSNRAPQPSGTPAPDHKPGVCPKPALADKQISKSSLISKLSQSEDSSNGARQNQTANVFPKPTSTNKTPQGSPINKRPQLEEPLKQPEDEPFFEAANVGLWQQIKNKLLTPKPGVSPAKQKALVIMVPILAIIMIFVLRQVLSKSPRKTKGAGMDDAPVVVANAGAGHEIDWKIPEPITIIARDPIILPDESNTQNPEQGEPNETTGRFIAGIIIVRDIVYSNDKPSAVIGSKIVYVGDVINGVTVVKIDRDSVEFEKNGDRWEQKVREEKKIPILEVTGQSEGQSETVQ
jgi:hypothetical protein